MDEVSEVYVLMHGAALNRALVGAEVSIVWKDARRNTYRISANDPRKRSAKKIRGLGREARATERTASLLLLFYLIRTADPDATLSTAEFLSMRRALPGWSDPSDASAATFFAETVRPDGPIITEASANAYRLREIAFTVEAQVGDGPVLPLSREQIAQLLGVGDMARRAWGHAWHFVLDRTLVVLLDETGQSARILHQAIARPAPGVRSYRWVMDGAGHDLQTFAATSSCGHELLPVPDGRGRFALEQAFACSPEQQLEFSLSYIANGMFTNAQEFQGARARYPTDLLEVAVEFPHKRVPRAFHASCLTEQEEPARILLPDAIWNSDSRRLVLQVVTPGYMLAYTLHWEW